MRRSIIAWITITLESAAALLILTSLPGVEFHQYRVMLGMSLGFLGITLSILLFWPNPGRVDLVSIVSVPPQWLVVIGARWPIRWRLVAYVAWVVLFFLALTVAVAVIFGDLGIAVPLGVVVAALNALGLLYVMVARLPGRGVQR